MGFFRNPLSESVTEATVTFTPFQENHWLRIIRKDGTIAFRKYGKELRDEAKFRAFWKKEKLAGIHASEVDLIGDHEEILKYLIDTVDAVINAIKQEIGHIDEIRKGNIRLKSSRTPRVQQEGEQLQNTLYRKILPHVRELKNRGNVLMSQATDLEKELA